MQRIALLESFTCLGSACEDTCCQGWGMQVDSATRQRYEQQASELLDAIGKGEAEFIMKRDCKTDRCIKLDTDNLCSIQKHYGETMLSDACHFYPRAFRSLGDETIMTATMSCPEIVRLAIANDQAAVAVETPTIERLPEAVKKCLPTELTAQEALAIHQAFIESTHDASASPQRILMRIFSVSQSMTRLDTKSWAQAVSFYMKNADSRLLAPEEALTDPFFLLQALCGIMAATSDHRKPRLLQTIASIEVALHASFDWKSKELKTHDDSLERADPLIHAWNQHYADHFAPILRRWLAMQLSAATYPFYGFGANLIERSIIIGVRFATLRLALMSACFVHQGIIPEAETVRIIQSLSRCLDHLADPTLSMQIYTDTGWIKEGRLRALVGDMA